MARNMQNVRKSIGVMAPSWQLATMAARRPGPAFDHGLMEDSDDEDDDDDSPPCPCCLPPTQGYSTSPSDTKTGVPLRAIFPLSATHQSVNQTNTPPFRTPFFDANTAASRVSSVPELLLLIGKEMCGDYMDASLVSMLGACKGWKELFRHEVLLARSKYERVGREAIAHMSKAQAQLVETMTFAQTSRNPSQYIAGDIHDCGNLRELSIFSSNSYSEGFDRRCVAFCQISEPTQGPRKWTSAPPIFPFLTKLSITLPYESLVNYPEEVSFPALETLYLTLLNHTVDYDIDPSDEMRGWQRMFGPVSDLRITVPVCSAQAEVEDCERQRAFVELTGVMADDDRGEGSRTVRLGAEIGSEGFGPDSGDHFATAWLSPNFEDLTSIKIAIRSRPRPFSLSHDPTYISAFLEPILCERDFMEEWIKKDLCYDAPNLRDFHIECSVQLDCHGGPEKIYQFSGTIQDEDENEDGEPEIVDTIYVKDEEWFKRYAKGPCSGQVGPP